MAALPSPESRRIWLDIERGVRTKDHFDGFQRIYFVVEGFEELLRATEETDLSSVYRKIASEAALEPEDAFPGDRAYHGPLQPVRPGPAFMNGDRKSTRLNSSH